MKRFLMPVLSVLLISLYPVASLYSANLYQVIFSETLLPAAVLAFFSLLFLFIFYLFLKDINLSSSLIVIFILLAFSFGHIYELFKKLPLPDIFFNPWLVIFLELLLYFIILKLLLKNKKYLEAVSRFIFIASLILIIIPVFSISSYFISNLKQNKILLQEAPQLKLTKAKKEDLPDIYFFIFDRYASSASLAKNFHYDNSDFTSFLTKKGFRVLEGSWANYYSSAHSIASTLNMDYLDQIVNSHSLLDPDWNDLYQLLQNHKVGEILKNFGYIYYHFGSWWWPTGKNRLADKNINQSPLSEFSGIIIKNSIFYPLAEKFKLPILDMRYAQWRRLQYKFDRLNQVPADKKPTFVFAHMLIPHEPFVFTKTGSFLEPAQESKLTLEEKYLGQLQYLNSRIVSLTDTILNQSPNSIIIFQADEGPYPDVYENDKNSYDWKVALPSQIEQKMSILNAVYFPDGDYSLFDQSESPVNTFRIVFDKYFSATFPLLSDRYFLGNMSHPYNLYEYKK